MNVSSVENGLPGVVRCSSIESIARAMTGSDLTAANALLFVIRSYCSRSRSDDERNAASLGTTAAPRSAGFAGGGTSPSAAIEAETTMAPNQAATTRHGPDDGPREITQSNSDSIGGILPGGANDQRHVHSEPWRRTVR